VVNRRTELNNLRASLTENQQKLEENLNQYANLKKKLASLDDETLSLEAKAQQVN
jgi:chromosome segregation ATPase